MPQAKNSSFDSTIDKITETFPGNFIYTAPVVMPVIGAAVGLFGPTVAFGIGIKDIVKGWIDNKPAKSEEALKHAVKSIANAFKKSPEQEDVKLKRQRERTHTGIKNLQKISPQFSTSVAPPPATSQPMPNSPTQKMEPA